MFQMMGVFAEFERAMIRERGGTHHPDGSEGDRRSRRGFSARRRTAEEVIDEIRDQLTGAHMVFVTAGAWAAVPEPAPPRWWGVRPRTRHPQCS
jgi:hypothetical protein